MHGVLWSNNITLQLFLDHDVGRDSHKEATLNETKHVLSAKPTFSDQQLQNGNYKTSI